MLFAFQAWAAELADVQVVVKGMVCSFCVQGIEKKFSSVDSVNKVQVDLDISTLSLWLKESKTLTDETITKLVQSAGYNVEEIKRVEPKKKDE
jgi:mercuric ion binding protein